MKFLSAVTAAVLLVAPIGQADAFTQQELMDWTDGVSLKEELTCLSKNIYFEGRGESILGQVAIAYVTLNRTVSSKFPSSICSVVYEGKYKESWKTKSTRDPFDAVMIPVRNRCQFSWFCDGKSDKILDRQAWKRAVNVATSVLIEHSTLNHNDPTKGALFYHADYVSPSFHKFNLTPTNVTIGKHIFYKE